MSGLLVKVKCDCKHRFRAKSRLAGRTVKCPHCGRPISIPSQDSDTLALSVDVNADGSTEPGPPASAAGLDWERCPECSGAQLKTTVICSNCGYNKRTAEVTKATALAADITFWHRLVPIVLIVSVISCLVQSQMDGGEFLMFFAFLGICGFATAIGSEFHDLGKGRTFVLSLIAFELIGGVRILYGQSIGMHKFDFLTMMMVGMPFLGAIALFGKSNGGSDNSGWFFGSSCGSGCGSSCGSSCGGGGCGGCGGD